MEIRSKKTKATVIALALTLVMALGGTAAYLAAAAGPITNDFDPSKVKVELTETSTDNGAVLTSGTNKFNILPGTSETKDPKIKATTDEDAYVYAIVTDKTQGLVEYAIDEDWTELTGCTATVVAKDKDGNDVTIDPTAEGVKIYYREVNGTDADDTFGPYSVLKGDKVAYKPELTNEQIEAATEPIQLIFNAYAIQKAPFNDAVKAWNQEVPVAIESVALNASTLNLSTTDSDQKTGQLTATVLPDNAPNKEVTWSSSNESVATVDDTGLVTAVATGTATITATSQADNSKTATCDVTVVALPNKGDLIKLDGQDEVYRVIKKDGSNVEVLAMSGVSKKFNSTSKTTNMGGTTVQQYKGSDLDTYLNEMFYATLTDNIKGAIQSQNITQYAYGRTSTQPTSSDYWAGTDGLGMSYYITKPGLSENVGSRNVYALDVEDVVNYLGEGNITKANVNKMFFGSETASGYCWMRSASTNDNFRAWNVRGNSGTLLNDYYDNTYQALAAFTINLSECSWTSAN